MATIEVAGPDQQRAENPPRENIVRALHPGYELREDGEDMPTMYGHFSVFNQWTEINSAWEGNFLERISPTAFDKTFAENRSGIRVLFQHGKDPQVGDKPLGTINELRSDDFGAYYEVGLFDTSYNRDLLPALRAGALGASFRFKVMRDEFNRKTEQADHNPDGLPERTIVEAKVMEFGPVTFPAYDAATAGVRSLTDDYIVRTLFGDPDRLRDFASHYIETFAPSTPAPAEATQEPERREIVYPSQSRKEFLTWLSSQSSTL